MGVSADSWPGEHGSVRAWHVPRFLKDACDYRARRGPHKAAEILAVGALPPVINTASFFEEIQYNHPFEQGYNNMIFRS